jgi:hypothetical protein
METPIVNKVAASGIITLDLSPYIPADEILKEFDLKPFLFREMILREKDYREALLHYDWSAYQDKYAAVFCSADAIIPLWAYMLAANYLHTIAQEVYFGNQAAMKNHLIANRVQQQIDPQVYKDKRVVVKGCGDVSVPAAAYVAITQKLRPVVKSLLYGEPCSTVPVYKSTRGRDASTN